ncbi:hypothetical protein GCM10010302_28590 [Streptomyces polychromogenes]|uniref:Uncharacterized protein n=1 Tax=Streptomyces polychromogenes TaxID=67342 RepID=A0ABN0VCT5_9ACTN
MARPGGGGTGAGVRLGVVGVALVGVVGVAVGAVGVPVALHGSTVAHGTRCGYGRRTHRDQVRRARSCVRAAVRAAPGRSLP